MQFCKLRYFLKLINARHTCNLLTFIIVLMAFTTLTTLTTTLVSSSVVDVGAVNADATSKAALNVFEHSIGNAAAQQTPTFAINVDTNTNSSTSQVTDDVDNNDDDFEQILAAQLKREEEAATSAKLSPNLKTQTKYTANGDYDTMTAAAAASAEPAPMATARKALLSRKRRYLLFPEGTSFQVVYDGIIGIVDYTNYLILGITLALAWELPTKPPSEQLDDIKQQVEDGSLLLPRNDTATNITYVDTKSSKKKFSKNQQKAKGQQTQPIYNDAIEGSQRKSYYKTKPYYNYYSYRKRPLLQPVFMPPMHRNYYYQHGYNQSPTDMRSNHIRQHMLRPDSTMKYAYYFQPHKSSNSMSRSRQRQREQDAYKRYYYGSFINDYGKEHAGDWRRKDNFYYQQAAGGNDSGYSHSTHPFKNWLKSHTAAATTAYTPYDRSKYPWWNLATRLTNSFRKSAASANRNQQARHFTNVNNDGGNDSDTDSDSNNDNNNDSSNPRQDMQSSEHNGYNQSLAFSSSSIAGMSSSSTTSTPTSRRMAATAMPQKHRIYPVFGKRSLPDNQHPGKIAIVAKAKNTTEAADAAKAEQPQHQKHQHQNQRKRFRRSGIASDELSKFDRIHIRHHRHTRHSLYEKIEKYLDKRGSHGHHCVLRALCETAKKSNEREPGTFLGELMRTVFTLPEPVDEDLHKLAYKENRYDAAHAYDGNCAARYFHCKDSLWKSHFIA